MSTESIAILMANEQTLRAQLDGVRMALRKTPTDPGLILYVRDTLQSLSGIADRAASKADAYLREASADA